MQVQSLGQKDPLGIGNGNLFQYSCLENFMDRGPWWATVHRVAKSLTRLSTHMIYIIVYINYTSIKKIFLT